MSIEEYINPKFVETWKKPQFPNFGDVSYGPYPTKRKSREPKPYKYFGLP